MKHRNPIQKVFRSIRYQYLKLLRSPGGARKVSLGFAIGFGLEMVVISTASLVYLIFYPVVRLSRASLSAAIIGNIIGKLTFLPILLLPPAHSLGNLLLPGKDGGSKMEEHSLSDIVNLFTGDFSILRDILHGGLNILVGMSLFGLILGIASYFVVHHLYERRRKTRKRKNRPVNM